ACWQQVAVKLLLLLLPVLLQRCQLQQVIIIGTQNLYCTISLADLTATCGLLNSMETKLVRLHPKRESLLSTMSLLLMLNQLPLLPDLMGTCGSLNSMETKSAKSPRKQESLPSMMQTKSVSL